ncbi:hypothetical protein ACQ0QQ_04575 [Lysinibacillus sphaericus]
MDKNSKPHGSTILNLGTNDYHPLGGMPPETALHLLHHPVFRHLPDPPAFPSIQGIDLFLAALLLSRLFHRFSLFLYKELLDFFSLAFIAAIVFTYVINQGTSAEIPYSIIMVMGVFYAAMGYFITRRRDKGEF